MRASNIQSTATGAPWYAYVAGLIASGVAFVTFVALRLALDLGGGGATVAAFAVCALFGALLTYIWPQGSWRLGICASATLAVFLGYVAITLGAQGRFDHWPAIEALGVIAFAAAGALAGRRFSR